ncbi:MAG: PEP/pyruvate-binding domain-containing protein [Dialister invisus]
MPDASFAGQQDTYLNVTGRDMVIRKVKECYASTFTTVPFITVRRKTLTMKMWRFPPPSDDG